MKDDLLTRIRRVNDYTDTREVADLRKSIEYLNTRDKKTAIIIEEAKNKGVLSK